MAFKLHTHSNPQIWMTPPTTFMRSNFAIFSPFVTSPWLGGLLNCASFESSGSIPSSDSVFSDDLLSLPLSSWPARMLSSGHSILGASRVDMHVRKLPRDLRVNVIWSVTGLLGWFWWRTGIEVLFRFRWRGGQGGQCGGYWAGFRGWRGGEWGGERLGLEVWGGEWGERLRCAAMRTWSQTWFLWI